MTDPAAPSLPQEPPDSLEGAEPPDTPAGPTQENSAPVNIVRSDKLEGCS